MTCSTPARRRMGYVVIGIWMGLTLLVWRSVHKETESIAKKQGIANAVSNSERLYPLVVIDDRGRVVEWNGGMEGLTGISCETAKREGLTALMCDSESMHKHDEGFKNAFLDPDSYGRTTVVNCSIKDQHGHLVPVRVAVRIMEGEDGEAYAVARVDKQSNVVEYGLSPQAKEVLKAEVEHVLQQSEVAQDEK